MGNDYSRADLREVLAENRSLREQFVETQLVMDRLLSQRYQLVNEIGEIELIARIRLEEAAAKRSTE